MINTMLDIIRLLNDGSIVPMQKDEDTKIDLNNEKVQLFVDASGEKSRPIGQNVLIETAFSP